MGASRLGGFAVAASTLDGQVLLNFGQGPPFIGTTSDPSEQGKQHVPRFSGSTGRHGQCHSPSFDQETISPNLFDASPLPELLAYSVGPFFVLYTNLFGFA